MSTGWIENARLILPHEVVEAGAVRLEDGVISDLREGGAPVPALDARGMTLLPGLIDLHGDMIERELEPRPGTRFDHDLALIELDKRLAASGVTTAFASLSFADGLGLRSDTRAEGLIRDLVGYRPHLLVDHRVHARYEVSNTDALVPLLALLDEGLVDLVSLMDHTPGQGQFRDMETYVGYTARWLGRPAEEVRALAHARLDAGTGEVWTVARTLGQAAQARGVSLASHDDDTPQKVELLCSLGVSISEFPVTLEAAQAATGRGLSVFMGAPNALRGASHSGNLSALDALEAGTLHGLASDYSPMTMLQAVWRVAREGRVGWPEAVALVSDTPAGAAGLTDRGRLEVGGRADLVLVEDAPGARPRVRLTVSGGRPVYHDGALAPQRVLVGF
ncbi:alpha-D-ribose 1-methylphosphonate 5-triphosphate diphosphatase [Deinococcus koreensis]|uniref:Alpha-D-ribose 1-methylphosphonate 5-triphosphate diphosphatase n=1 Tax=Deinococcus koreensis TaxID=2054903 RepID=A0A2K3V2D3_9DEIO|nr:alpha-D-ribose 1-methylphosphonate 5-triphosphate diphosphatase [Deinococcus koreensis]